ncbi:MAG: tetratricopeptide repeat protein, partial [Actinomycetota bacterium]|nr:tetratricopeptide repeat protein [Actinomycetota bacterium]
APPKPDIPRDVEADLPGGVLRELRRHSQDPDEIARALTLAVAAVDAGAPDRARPYLEWAKAAAPRAPSVRETLGVALYHAEDWSGALSELQTYRRLSGRSDQNHLIGDCLRGLGRSAARVAEVVQELDPDRDGDDRYAEGMIVWASALADHGDPGAGRAVIRRTLDRLGQPTDPQEHHLRLWYIAADLAERDGDRDDAERWLRRIAAEDDDLYDVRERLARLAG